MGQKSILNGIFNLFRPMGRSEMDSCLNFLENGGTERSRAHFEVRFMVILVFHEFGLFLYRGVHWKYTENILDIIESLVLFWSMFVLCWNSSLTFKGGRCGFRQ